MIDTAQNIMAEGSSVAVAQVSGVNDNMSQSHFHDYFEMYFLDSGERYHLMDDKLFKIQTGDCIIFPPQTMHRSYGNPDVSFSRVVLYFRPEIITSEELLNRLLHSESVYRPDSQGLQQLRRLVYSMLKEQDSHYDCHAEYMQALVNLIMVTILRMNQENTGIIRETRITRVIQYIHNHYAEDITLADLSRQFYVSEYYLCREFKKSTNRTIVEYIRRTRIMNAQRLFMETDKNVTAVARETGFSNLTHFNRVFRDILGVTPSNYRKQCQKLHRQNMQKRG